MALLEKINTYEDFKDIPVESYPVLADEIRLYLNKIVTENGGHLASNLGVVELTLVLHYLYDAPKDKIIWDVGHQSYVHKIITGRREALATLRKEKGLSGFPRAEESVFDAFDTGHSSTSISAALGYARARDLSGGDYDIAAVIGDGSLTGGLVYEALNDLGAEQKKVLIILNDNKMSISANVGAMSKYLNRLRINKNYTYFKHSLRKFMNNIPLVGESLTSVAEKSRDMLRFAVVGGKMFEQFGVKYIGPIDGHNFESLLSFINYAKSIDGPVLLHVLTNKGKGNYLAENNPSKFHGVSGNGNSDEQEGVDTPQTTGTCEKTITAKNERRAESFSEAAGKTVAELAAADEKVVVFSAAMPDGTGMSGFAEKYPDRFFDVGIAEEHAVTCAAGMAKGGFKPYVAIYSTFLQRAFDEIIHDVCMQNLPVKFLIDRAGIVGEDGASHQGLYDLSYLRLMPNMTIVAPKDTSELKKIIEWGNAFNTPLAIRYPKSSFTEYNSGFEIEYGKWEVLKKGNNNIAIIAAGNNMLNMAMRQKDCTVINPLFIKPLDAALLEELRSSGKKIIVLEENTLIGGLYSAIAEFYSFDGKNAELYTLPVKDIFVRHGSISSTLERLGITSQSLERLILKILNK